MRIIGFAFEKISVSKEKTIDSKLKVSSNINIKDIFKERIENLNEEVLKLQFEFTIKYEPKTANIELAGFVLLSVDKSTSKEILKKWKSKKISDNVRLPIFNFILTKCNIKALTLEEDLNLPSHIPMPRLTNQPQGNNQTYVQ